MAKRKRKLTDLTVNAKKVIKQDDLTQNGKVVTLCISKNNKSVMEAGVTRKEVDYTVSVYRWTYNNILHKSRQVEEPLKENVSLEEAESFYGTCLTNGLD